MSLAINIAQDNIGDNIMAIFFTKNINIGDINIGDMAIYRRQGDINVAVIAYFSNPPSGRTSRHKPGNTDTL